MESTGKYIYMLFNEPSEGDDFIADNIDMIKHDIEDIYQRLYNSRLYGGYMPYGLSVLYINTETLEYDYLPWSSLDPEEARWISDKDEREYVESVVEKYKPLFDELDRKNKEKSLAEAEKREREQYERLKAKFEPDTEDDGR